MSDLVIVGARNVSHIEAMADAQSTPILNMTSDLKDPLQVLAYFLTIQVCAIILWLKNDEVTFAYFFNWNIFYSMNQP